ncbi:hypothetical protein B7755_026420 [Streptomyces sp. NBS 14/10]|nr:hypothetical protein [Streptomyces sp. NBS 14/10]KAK1181365.1 hypothetical protein B7755_026420 [Streptomyces sp. NBS 14/10]
MPSVPLLFPLLAAVRRRRETIAAFGNRTMPSNGEAGRPVVA